MSRCSYAMWKRRGPRSVPQSANAAILRQYRRSPITTMEETMNILSRLASGLSAAVFSVTGFAAEPLKIAFIDPLSGPFANVGEMEVRAYQYAIDIVNARGGVLGGTRLELVAFDNKANPQDSLLALKQVTDQGIRYITQGNSSAV